MGGGGGGGEGRSDSADDRPPHQQRTVSCYVPPRTQCCAGTEPYTTTPLGTPVAATRFTSPITPPKPLNASAGEGGKKGRLVRQQPPRAAGGRLLQSGTGHGGETLLLLLLLLAVSVSGGGPRRHLPLLLGKFQP